MKGFVLFFVTLVALCTVPETAAFYGSCNEPQLYFFAAPYVNMSAIEIVHALDSMKSLGVEVSVNVTNAPQLLVVINATADHTLTADFTPTDPTLSTIRVTVSDQFGNSASSPSGSLALSLAAAGLVAAGTANGKPGAGLGAATLAAGAAVGLGLFGPLASADESKCPVSFVQATVYIPGTVRSYTINNSDKICNVPYSLNDTTEECSVCNSQFTVYYQGMEIPYPCVEGATECCEGEFCTTETLMGNTLTRCCAKDSQINSTTCCPLLTPYYLSMLSQCRAVCTNATTGAPIICDQGYICYEEHTCVPASGGAREYTHPKEAEVDFAAPELDQASLQAGLARQVFPSVADYSSSFSSIKKWTSEELSMAYENSI